MKIRRSVRSVLVALLAFGAGALFATGASAAVTATNITTPASPLYTLYYDTEMSGSISVAGTATATDGDLVDLRCYAGAASAILQSNVPVNGGQFSVANDSLQPISNRACRLRAVPAGTNPSDLSPFTGPALYNSYDEKYHWSGKLQDFFVYGAQRDGAFDYDSFGSCGVTDSYLFDPDTLGITTVPFFCNQWVDKNPASTGMNLTIDGRNGYAASNLSEPMAVLPGFQPLSYTLQHDPANGNITITELQELMICGSNVYPPSAVGCADLQAAGIRLNRSIVQNHDGLMTHVTDVFTNTSAAPHTLSLGYSQWYCMQKSGCNSTTVRYEFPTGQSVTSPPLGTAIAGPLPDSGTITTSVEGSPDGDKTTGRTALTYFPAADGATFRNSRTFDLFYNNRVIAPGGSFKTSAVFSQSYSQAQLLLLIGEASRMVTPQPEILVSKTTARYDKRKKRVRLNTGRRVICPATGKPCDVSASVTTQIKVKRRGKKARTKTYKLGSFKAVNAPGSSQLMSFHLNKTATTLFKRYKRLKLTMSFSVSAGPYATAESPFANKNYKSPRFPKKKKRRR